MSWNCLKANTSQVVSPGFKRAESDFALDEGLAWIPLEPPTPKSPASVSVFSKFLCCCRSKQQLRQQSSQYTINNGVVSGF